MQEGDGLYLVTVITAEMLMFESQKWVTEEGGRDKVHPPLLVRNGAWAFGCRGVGLAFLVILWLSSFQTHVQRAGRKLQMQSELLCLYCLEATVGGG